MQRARVFTETYQNYLAEIGRIDFLAKAEVLGATRADDALLIPLYDRVYRCGKDGISCAVDQSDNPAIRVILLKYILDAPWRMPPANDVLKSYREFKDAGPLISYFTTNTSKIIETTFSGNIEGLTTRAEDIGGQVVADDCYDLSVRFWALPRIPVLMNFNDRDELFTASCSILYTGSAEYFLDMECLAMTGTLLAGKLLQPGK